MSFIEAMQERYTTKMYNASKKIPAEKIEALKEILRLSPSSINSQPWEFTFVQNPKIKDQLAEVSRHNAEKVTHCDTVVVFNVIDDVELFEKQITNNLPERAVRYYNSYLKPLPEEEIKQWFGRQVYLALGVLLSACAEMQIDSTPMEGIEMVEYDKVLENSQHKTIVAVALGYRDKQDSNQPSITPKMRRKKTDVIKEK